MHTGALDALGERPKLRLRNMERRQGGCHGIGVPGDDGVELFLRRLGKGRGHGKRGQHKENTRGCQPLYGPRAGGKLGEVRRVIALSLCMLWACFDPKLAFDPKAPAPALDPPVVMAVFRLRLQHSGGGRKKA